MSRTAEVVLPGRVTARCPVADAGHKHGRRAEREASAAGTFEASKEHQGNGSGCSRSNAIDGDGNCYHCERKLIDKDNSGLCRGEEL